MQTSQLRPTGRTPCARAPLALAWTLVLALGTARPAAASANGWVIKEGHATHSEKHLALQLNAWSHQAGLALWFAFPLLQEGMIPDANDALLLEVGGLLGFYGGGNPYQSSDIALSLGVGPRWDFYLTRIWSAFVAAKLGLNFGFGAYSTQAIAPILALGSQIRLSDLLMVRFELGWPFGVGLGLTFRL